MEHSPLSHSLFLSNPVMRGNPTLPLCGPRTPQCTLQAALASLSDQCHVGPGVMYSSIVCNSWGRARSLPLGKLHFPILGLAAHWTLSSSLPLFPVSRTSCTRFWLCALGFQNFTDQTQCWHKLHFLLVECRVSCVGQSVSHHIPVCDQFWPLPIASGLACCLILMYRIQGDQATTLYGNLYAFCVSRGDQLPAGIVHFGALHEVKRRGLVFP